MQNFQTAKNLLSTLIYVGWAFVALCIVAGFVAMDETNVIFAIIGAGLLSIFGFLIVATAQLGLAQIATAENTRRMVVLLEATKGAGTKARNGNDKELTERSPDTIGSKEKFPSKRRDGDVVQVYKTSEIVKSGEGVSVDGKQFQTAFDAKVWLNKKYSS